MTPAQIRKELKDLFDIRPLRVYGELSLYIVFGWVCFVFTVTQDFLPMLIPAGLFFYKGLSFIHEISHLEKTMPRLKTIYNVFLGFAHRVPAYTMRTHKYHHGISTFGLMTDPEYENWTNRPKFHLLRPLTLSPLYPLVLCLRFGIWPMILLFLPHKYTKITYEKYSSFVMNLKYVRPYQEDDYNEYVLHDRITSLYFILTCILLWRLNYLSDYLFYWSIMVIGIYILNTYRALVAHRYQVDKNPHDNKQIEQLIDSVTIEGDIITPLWAPIGLQYHSTHHLLPSLPYYSLRKAHYRLKKILPEDHPYHKTIEGGFLVAFKSLLKSCGQGKINLSKTV